MDNLIDRLRALIRRQQEERGDYLYLGKADPEIIEAADRITALEAENAGLREGLEPFAQALVDWGDDGGQPDRWSAWEHPIALNVTLGDFRRAATLKNKDKSNG